MSTAQIHASRIARGDLVWCPVSDMWDRIVGEPSIYAGSVLVVRLPVAEGVRTFGPDELVQIRREPADVEVGVR